MNENEWWLEAGRDGRLPAVTVELPLTAVDGSVEARTMDDCTHLSRGQTIGMCQRTFLFKAKPLTLASLEPSRNAVEVERVLVVSMRCSVPRTHVADTPGDGAALALGALVGLALDACGVSWVGRGVREAELTEVHNVVTANGAVVDDNVCRSASAVCRRACEARSSARVEHSPHAQSATAFHCESVSNASLSPSAAACASAQARTFLTSKRGFLSLTTAEEGVSTSMADMVGVGKKE